MVYRDIEQFLRGIERAGYRYAGAVYGQQSDIIFYSDRTRTVILENRGRVMGFMVYHSSTLAGVEEEMRRIRAHHPDQFKLHF